MDAQSFSNYGPKRMSLTLYSYFKTRNTLKRKLNDANACKPTVNIPYTPALFSLVGREEGVVRRRQGTN